MFKIFFQLAKNKLKKFAELKTLAHVIEPPIDEPNKSFDLKGQWRRCFFKNENPITLELGCGRGEYTVALAKKFPQKIFIGIDVKGSRIWSGAKETKENKLTNVGFLRTRIDLIQKYFSKNEIDEIWITFPDPQLKRSRLKKRLTHPKFLNLYNQILKPNSVIHLKTDSQFFHGFTLGVIAGEGHILQDSTNDLYASEVQRDDLDIKTYYEKIFLKKGMSITYLKFILNY